MTNGSVASRSVQQCLFAIALARQQFALWLEACLRLTKAATTSWLRWLPLVASMAAQISVVAGSMFSGVRPGFRPGLGWNSQRCYDSSVARPRRRNSRRSLNWRRPDRRSNLLQCCTLPCPRRRPLHHDHIALNIDPCSFTRKRHWGSLNGGNPYGGTLAGSRYRPRESLNGGILAGSRSRIRPRDPMEMYARPTCRTKSHTHWNCTKRC